MDENNITDNTTDIFKAMGVKIPTSKTVKSRITLYFTFTFLKNSLEDKNLVVQTLATLINH